MLPFPPTHPLSRIEFIALAGLLMATVAFSIDAMLPAMGHIGTALSPDVPAQAQLVVPFFVIGLGFGTFMTGPLSDSFGRRPVIVVGGVVFALGTLMAQAAQSLEMLLLARAIQGMGASASRVVAVAMIRDQYSGREMARIMSFVIIVFTMVPAIAPSIGATILWLAGWRAIFFALFLFALTVVLWFYLRQPETLPVTDRHPFRARRVLTAMTTVLVHPMVRACILVQTLCYAMLFTMLSITQPVFDIVLGAADTFHLWFGGVALVAILGPMLNAKLVVTYGIHKLVSAVITVQLASFLVCAGILLNNPDLLTSIPLFFLWQVVTFSMAGMTLGNLNALALEPMGHVAGTASSLITAIGTLGAGLLAVPAARVFEDSQWPVIWVIFGFAVVARIILTSSVFRPVSAKT